MSLPFLALLDLLSRSSPTVHFDIKPSERSSSSPPTNHLPGQVFSQHLQPEVGFFFSLLFFAQMDRTAMKPNTVKSMFAATSSSLDYEFLEHRAQMNL